MDKIRQRAQSLLEKLHGKYGIQARPQIRLVVATMGKKDGEGIELQDSWYLVDAHGQKFRLPRTTLFMGREESDIIVASQSVDRRHAILAFDHHSNQFKLKDLGTANGTFVNNSRIPEQEYVTLNHMDSLRLGQDAMMYHVEQGSQITSHGGQLPDPYFIPAWASRVQDPATIHVHSHALAECQGCIAEQNIEHTCSLKIERKPNEGSVQIHESHEHCHSCCPHHEPQRAWVGGQPSSKSPVSHHEPQRAWVGGQPSSKSPVSHHEPQRASKSPVSHHEPQRAWVGGQPSSKSPVSHHEPQRAWVGGQPSPVSHHEPQRAWVGGQPSSKSPVSHHEPQRAWVGGQPSSKSPVSHHEPQRAWVAAEHRSSNSPASSCQEGYDHIHEQDQHLDQPSQQKGKEDNTNDTASLGQPVEARDQSNSGPTDEASSSAPSQGRNTWPFKRQLRQVAHVGSIFQPGAEDGQDRPGGEAQSAGAMFFVAFDDSVCNSSSSSSSNQGRQHLPPHKTNSSQVPDLVSVTRETWAGSTDSERVDTSTGSLFTLGGESRDASEGSQPTSPSYSKRKAWRATPPTQLTGSRTCSMENEANHIRPAYMEIPMRDGDGDDDGCTEETDKSRDDFNANKAAKAKSPSAEVHSPTSFTIDFDGPQHSPKKHLNIGSSLSAFVPSKLRKGFQDRKAMSSKSAAKEQMPNKNSEERELSPLSDAKVDEIWGKVRQSGITQVPSGAAPDAQDTNQPTDGVLEKRGSDRETERRDSLRKPVMTSKSPKMSRSFKLHSTSSNESDPGSPTTGPQPLSIFKPARSSKLLNHEHDPTGSTTASQALSTSVTSSRSSKLFSNSSNEPAPGSSTAACQSLSNPRTPRLSKLFPSSSNEPSPGDPTTVPHSLNISKYPNTTSYLIDKMFEGGTPASILHDKPRPRDHQPGSRGDGHHTSEKTHTRPETDSSYSGESPPAKLPSKSTKTSQKIIIHDDDNDDDLRITEDVPVVDEKEDKNSEAGTYTIEADANEGQDAEDEARKRIPEVFGLDLDNLNLESRNIDFFTMPDPAAGRDGDDEQDTLLDEDSHSPGDDDTDVHLGNESDDENSDITAIDDIQTWVSQQATTTTTTNDEDEAQGPSTTAKTEGDVSLSKKPPQGLSRARPGTGRKLPSVPIDSKSPSHSNSQPPSHHIPPGGRAAETSKHSADRNHGANSGSGQAHSKTVNNGYRGSLGSSAPGFKLPHHITAAPSSGSPAHISSRTCNARTSQDSDNETSASSVVNGDEAFAVPSLYKSPRDYFEKKQQLTKSSSTATSASANTGKKLLVKSQSQAATKSATPPRNPPPAIGFRASDVSNISKRKDSIDNDSIISDVGSDNSSKGKQTLTKTRMNKTFELRRARADSFDSPSTTRPKSASMAKPGPSSSLNKPNSLSSSLRNKNLFDSERVPTGALAARRSLNIPPEDLRRPAKAAVSRTDSGLHSPGLQRASSLATSHPALGSKRELNPKSHLRSTPTGRTKLTLANFAGITNRSQSQPNSRSNSPKSAEKIAWERRKGYDARKSVAEAKASKTKDTDQPSGTIIRAKPSTGSNSIRNMIRSASFTNSAGLSHGLRSSAISSSQELSHPRDSHHHHHQHPDPCRAFIPIHSSQQNGKSPNSADEYDTLGAAHIIQDNTTSLMLLQEAPSAFTPPLLLRNKSVTPDSSSPSEPSLSLRRRTLNMDGQSSPHFVRAAQVNGDGGGGGGGGGGYVGHHGARHLPQASYDTLIVSSVYQLSQKLRTSTDNALNKLRHQHRISQTPPPSDDYLNDSGRSEITAWKTANQELASTLKNLRTLERQVQMMQTALFTDVDVDSQAAALVPEHKQKRLEDMERKYGFQPIEQPAPHHHQVEEAEVVSPEIVELSGQFT